MDFYPLLLECLLVFSMLVTMFFFVLPSGCQSWRPAPVSREEKDEGRERCWSRWSWLCTCWQWALKSFLNLCLVDVVIWYACALRSNAVSCVTVSFGLRQFFHEISFPLYVADTLERKACDIMAELVEGLQSILALGHHRNSVFPAFLTPTLRNIVISLSRLPLVNCYTRVPPLVSVCDKY